MVQLIEPKYERTKEFKNLILTVRCYDDTVQILLNEIKTGHLVFSKHSSSSEDDDTLSEVDSFIEHYDKELENQTIKESEKMYYHTLKHFLMS